MAKTLQVSRTTGKLVPVKLSSAKLAAIQKDCSTRFNPDFMLKKMSKRGVTRERLQPK